MRPLPGPVGSGPTEATAPAAAHEATAVRLGSYAGLMSRAIALWIDTLVVALLVALTSAVVRSLLGSLGVSSTTIDDRTGPLALAAGSAVVWFTYYTVGFAFFGRTVGKLLLGLRVVRADGRNPSAWRSAVRTVGYVLSSILLLGFLWAGVDDRRQAWHDKLAGTFVVYAWEARSAAQLVPRVDRPLVPQDPATGSHPIVMIDQAKERVMAQDGTGSRATDAGGRES